MATISELVAHHGLPIRVGCGQQGYPPFTIVEKTGERKFRVRYDDGKEGVVWECDWLSDYNLIE